MLFQLPRTYLGIGAIKHLALELRSLGSFRPLIVSDLGLMAIGIVDRVASALEDCVTFAEVHSNPVFRDAEEAANLYRNEKCDAIVALGGGSVIDAAKFTGILVSNGGGVADYVGPSNIECALPPLIAIPTTAGTGSECSPDAGIHPDETTSSVGTTNAKIVPAIAILDPELTLTLPPRLTAATGIDALSHCVEGLLSLGDSPFVEAFAMDGVRRTVRWLPRAVVAGDDIEARLNMQAAAYAGGVAIGKGLGPAHAMAISCSDEGLHHGVLSGIGLLATLELVLPHAGARADDLAAALGLTAPDAIKPCIEALMKNVGLPCSLREAGYVARDLDALAEAARVSHFNCSSRYWPSAAEYHTALAAQLA